MSMLPYVLGYNNEDLRIDDLNGDGAVSEQKIDVKVKE